MVEQVTESNQMTQTEHKWVFDHLPLSDIQKQTLLQALLVGVPPCEDEVTIEKED